MLINLTLFIAFILFAVSVQKVRPLVSTVWGATKNLVSNTPVKRLVYNPVVEKVEVALNNLTDTVISKISILRDKQLPGEIRYLEQELEKIRRKLGDVEQENGNRDNKQFPCN